MAQLPSDSTFESAPRRSDDAAVRPGLLDQVAPGETLLATAVALSAKAATVGFDWRAAVDVLDKIEEEVAEVRVLLQGDNTGGERGHPMADRLTDEVGDILFAVANLARALSVNPDAALSSTIAKFRRRFGDIEESLAQAGRSFEACTLEDLDALWNEAKKRESGSRSVDSPRENEDPHGRT